MNVPWLLGVHLTQGEVNEADRLADRRFASGRENNQAYHSEASFRAESIEHEQRDVLGARTEYAMRVWLKPDFPEGAASWNAFTATPNALLPDFVVNGVPIDVKGCRFFHHSLIVKDRPKAPLKPDWVYVLICAEDHPYYWLGGWCWGKQVKDRGEWRVEYENAGAWYIKPKDLRPIHELTLGLRALEDSK